MHSFAVRIYWRLDMTKKYMSFFSGALGLDIGLENAGLEAVCYNEIEKKICKTIRANRPTTKLYECDIRELTAKKLMLDNNIKKGELFAVVGGPPCQAFSTAGKRKGLDDDRGNVFLHYIDLIEELRPKYAIIENVRGLLSTPLKHRPHNQRGKDFEPLTVEESAGGALAHILKKLESAGYTASFTLYNSANFGVPQIRERVVILASRDGKNIPYLAKTHSDKDDNLPPWNTTRSAIYDLMDKKNLEHSEFPEKRLRFYRLLEEGQNWKGLPVELQKEAMGKSFYSGGGKTGFLRRLAWDKPSPTVVTSPTMPATDLCHPEKNRPLSVEEYARIQTFPDDYKFIGKTIDKYKQIGNAVPCLLGEAIGNHLIQFDNNTLKNFNTDGKLSRYLDTDHISWYNNIKKDHKNLVLFQ
jgi:DNA (cytosine-5)-methyltransferase 1